MLHELELIASRWPRLSERGQQQYSSGKAARCPTSMSVRGLHRYHDLSELPVGFEVAVRVDDVAERKGAIDDRL